MVQLMEFIATMLNGFMGSFHRCEGFQVFVVVIFGFLTRQDNLGVTSFVRSLEMNSTRYDSLLHFFRSGNFSMDGILRAWVRCVKSTCKVVMVAGKVLLLADHTQHATQGERKPAVEKLSRYGNKAFCVSYFFGVFWGLVGCVIEGPGGFFCLPLYITIQQGLKGLASWIDEGRTDQEKMKERIEPRLCSSVVQTIVNAYKIALLMGPSIIVLDRFFLTVPLLKKLQEQNDYWHLLDVITRAKMNVVAYLPPPPVPKGKRGRRPKKGAKVQLAEYFENEEIFSTDQAVLYGKKEEIRYYVIDLLWGATLYMPVRFVLTIRDGKKAIFVSTDLSLTGIQIIESYCHRFKIEITFREFKQRVAGCLSRFWTKSLPKLNRYKKRGEPGRLTEVTSDADREKILDTLDATERYAQFACIALGMAQIIATVPRFASMVRRHRWLRTAHKTHVSEATVMWYLQRNIRELVAKTPQLRVTRIITEFRWPSRRGAEPRCGP